MLPTFLILSNPRRVQEEKQAGEPPCLTIFWPITHVFGLDEATRVAVIVIHLTYQNSHQEERKTCVQCSAGKCRKGEGSLRSHNSPLMYVYAVVCMLYRVDPSDVERFASKSVSDAWWKRVVAVEKGGVERSGRRALRAEIFSRLGRNVGQELACSRRRKMACDFTLTVIWQHVTDG